MINLFLGTGNCGACILDLPANQTTKNLFHPDHNRMHRRISGFNGKCLCFLPSFNLDGVLTATLIPKSVTAPIAIEISTQLGGIPSVTVAIVIITGIIGAILAPYLIRFLGISDPVAAGIAIGCSSHGIGTAKAIEIGDIEGAMSGIAIGVSGLITAVLIMIF